MMFEDPRGRGVDLHLPHRVKTTGLLGSEIKAADARKETAETLAHGWAAFLVNRDEEERGTR